jgi:hypothetical protein
MTRTLWLSFAGVLVAVAGTQPAYSQEFDYKIFPGSFCQAQLPDQAASFQRFRGHIYNINNPNRPTVTCPIVRDRVPHFGKTDELTKIDACVHFTYQPSLGKPVCWWVSEDEWGGMLNPPFGIAPIPNDVSLTQVSLCWELSPIDLTGKPLMAIDGTYSIWCEMPMSALLLRYVVGEWGSTEAGGF